MTTEFISLLPPPGQSISHYDRNASHDSQRDSHIPHIFLEVMSIREEIFVKEQHVPIENELDEDDARSFHWVTYVSVGQSSHGSNSNAGQRTNGRSGSTASRLAVGTVRLVPPPHPPHVPAASDHDQGVEGSEPSETQSAHSSPFNPHHEPFVKIGRLAVLKPYRGLGLAKLLMDNAMTWAASHPSEVLPPMSAADREAKKMEGRETDDIGERWKGLVLVHAQSYLEGLYQRWGFEKDESMGEWDEEGIMHIGMWKRLNVKDK